MKIFEFAAEVIILIFFISISISFSKIYIEKNVLIEEKEDFILQNIIYVDISTDGNKLLFSDTQTGAISQFDYNSGILLNCLNPSLVLSDLVAQSKAKPTKFIEQNETKIIERTDWKFITFLEEGKINPGKSHEATLKDLINNIYSISKYYNNGIISLAYINVPKISNPFDYVHVQAATEFFEFDNKLQHIKVFPLNQENKDVPPLPTANNFCFFHNYYYVTTLDLVRTMMYKKNDSLPILAVYNKNGNFIKIKRYLPYLYDYSNLGYLLTDNNLLLETDNEDIYSSFWFVDYIDFLNKSYQIKLKGLPYANKSMFKKLKLYCQKKGTYDIEYYEILKFLPLMIKNLIPVHKQIGVLSTLYEVKNQEYVISKYFLQLYNKTGELVKQDTIKNINNNGALQYVTYNNTKNKLLIFRKSNDKGWTMEVAKWD